MKEILKFVCEICYCEYTDKSKAMLCEEKGVESALVEIGKKLIYAEEELFEGQKLEWKREIEIVDIKVRGHFQNYEYRNVNSSGGGIILDNKRMLEILRLKYNSLGKKLPN